MTLTIDAIYENGVLKPAQPLPLKEIDRVTLTIHFAGNPRGYGLIRWTGRVEDLDYLIDAVDNDPLEAP